MATGPRQAVRTTVTGRLGVTPAHLAAVAVIPLLASLVPGSRALAQGRIEGVIGVSAYVMPAPRIDTIPAARMPEWRSPVRSSEPVLIRGAMVRDTVAGDERRPLVLAYTGT